MLKQKSPEAFASGLSSSCGWTGLENEISPASTRAHAHPSRVLDGESSETALGLSCTAVHSAFQCRNVATDPIAVAIHRAAELWNRASDVSLVRRALLDALLLLDA